MERVALYCRVSTEEQAKHGLSLAEQEHTLTEYAKERKMKVIDAYVDAGISGRKRYTKRPEMLRLLEDVKADKIDTILFIRLDRWFRSVGDYYEVQRILDDHHVSWRATQDDYETVTASGRFKVNIMLSVAQDEADRTSERIKFVFDGKRERGEPVGKLPFGYRLEGKHIVKDEVNAPIVRKIFDVYLETGSPSSVMESVPEANLSYQQVRRILKKEAYVGNFNGIQIDPIITQEERERILKTIKAPVRRNQTNRIYLFTGLMRCPKCGARMKGMPCHNVKYNKDYMYYTCSNRDDKRGCSESRTYRETKIEQYLLEHIDSKLSVLINSKPSQKQTSYGNERKAIAKKLSKLSDLYINDLIEIEDYKRQYKQLQDALAAIPPDRPQKNYKQAKQLFFADWQEIYLGLPREEKRLFWRNALEEIKVDNGEVVDFIFR